MLFTAPYFFLPVMGCGINDLCCSTCLDVARVCIKYRLEKMKEFKANSLFFGRKKQMHILIILFFLILNVSKRKSKSKIVLLMGCYCCL